MATKFHKTQFIDTSDKRCRTKRHLMPVRCEECLKVPSSGLVHLLVPLLLPLPVFTSQLTAVFNYASMGMVFT